MKKKILILFLLVFAIVPFFSVKAEEPVPIDAVTISARTDVINKFYTNFNEDIELKKNIFGSSATLGRDVNVNKDIDGIAFVFGEKVEVNSFVEYLLLASTDSEINGTINRDAFAFGSTLLMNKDSFVTRDAFLSGQNVTVRGHVGRNLNIYSSLTVDLKGAVIDGDVYINSPQIKIDSKTVINGTLKYNKNASIEISEKATIGSKKTFDNTANQPSWKEKAISELYYLIRLLVVFIVAVLLFPNFFTKMSEDNRESNNVAGSTLLVGLTSLLLIPILSIILVVTNFGLSLGVLLLVFYGFMIYMSTLISGYFVGSLIFSRLNKSEENPFMVGAIGIIILRLLYLVPVIGIFIMLASFVMSLGLIIRPILLKNAK